MKLYAFLKNSYMKLHHMGIFNFLPDKLFIPFIYRLSTGKKLNLANPQTFNEKLQWIKLYDRNPLYTQLVDKYAVRQYVSNKIGSEYLIPILGHWNHVKDIDFDSLPNEFVLKCNHDSGGIIICTNKENLDQIKTKKELNYHLKQNHYYLSREWAYKNVKPCIICEKYMIDEKTQDLRDYKFFCFNGVPKFIQVDFDRFTNHRRNLYSLNWEFLNVTIKCPNDPSVIIEKPSNLEEMIEISKKLSMNIPEVRVDLYSVNGKTYFGELTLYHGGGIEKFTPEKFGFQAGSWIDLALAYRGSGK